MRNREDERLPSPFVLKGGQNCQIDKKNLDTNEASNNTKLAMHIK